MKKFLLLFIATAIFFVSFGNRITEIKPVLNANNIFIPVGKTGKSVSLMELSTISAKNFRSLLIAQ
jgi:hypothetical protein